MKHDLNKFTNAYLEAVYFTDAGPDDECHCAELSEQAESDARADCYQFLEEYGDKIPARLTEQAAHDFWFTRNGHGVGFWDRPEIYGDKLAKLLTDAVGWRTKYPETSVYLGDDGKAHFS